MIRQLTVAEIAEDAFLKAERVRSLEVMNMPTDYEERKKAFVELAVAKAEANASALLLVQATKGDDATQNSYAQ